MTLSSIRGRLGVLLLTFFILISVSVGITFWGIEAQKQDALVINLAGRQRMFVQRMSRLALEIEAGESELSALELKQVAKTFEQTLAALTSGGQAPYSFTNAVTVDPAFDPQILQELDQVSQTWGVYRSYLDILLDQQVGSPEFRQAYQILEGLSPVLVNQADSVVRTYEVAAQQKIARLRWVQAGFLVTAFALLAAGALMTRRTVIEPLKSLSLIATRIGSGDLTTPVMVSGPVETKILAGVLETMRSDLQASQEAVLAWGANLEERVSQRTRELDALYEVSQEISSHLEINQVLRSVTEKARQLLKAEIAFLCLLENEREVLQLRATSGPHQAIRVLSASAQNPLASQVLAGKDALPCGVDGCQGFCGIIAAPYQVSHLAAPLFVGERVIGALCVGSTQPRAFGEDSSDLLTKLAIAAAVALENARLYAQAERVAALEERHRIAAEIHDGLGQLLSYLGLTIDQVSDQLDNGASGVALAGLQKARSTVDLANQTVRSAITSLIEETPVSTSLQERLETQVRVFGREHQAPVDFESNLAQPLNLLPEDMDMTVRLVQEALLNAHRHSQASRIRVRLSRLDEEVIISIADDGQGFDPGKLPEDGRKHFGLKIIQARAVQLGGRVEIHSALGEGTCVILAFPLKPERGTARMTAWEDGVMELQPFDLLTHPSP